METRGWLRWGTGLLASGAVALLGLMAFTLIQPWLSERAASRAQAATAEAAVFLPDEDDWSDFVTGVRVCTDRKLADWVESSMFDVTIVTAERRQRIRFTRKDRPGSLQIRSDAAALAREARQFGRNVVAVIGADRTNTTQALMEGLEQGASETGVRPVLLIPGATAVHVVSESGGSTELLRLYPKSSFRFSINNHEAAARIVSFALAQAGKARPGKILIVQDGDEPYASDLADGFSQAIERALGPETPIESREYVNIVGSKGMSDDSSIKAKEWARDIWRQARELPEGRPFWLVVPLLMAPAEPILNALRDIGSEEFSKDSGRLHILCGDSLTYKTLSEQYAPQSPFVLYGIAASMLSGPVDPVSGRRVQIEAEIVSALIAALDGPSADDARSLRDRMASIRIRPDDRAAFGRTIEFADDGERQGHDLCQILTVTPGDPKVSAYAQTLGGEWRPVTVPPPNRE